MTHRDEKLQDIEMIRDTFSRASSAVLLDFRGVTVESITELRSQFRKAGVQYKVVKNKLVKHALKGTALESKTELHKGLVGLTGIAWSFEDPSIAAKVVKNFRKDGGENAEKLTVKCGVLGDAIIAGARVETDLASLPGKNEIRAMLLATLQAPAQSLVRLLTAPGQNLAYVLDARARVLSESK